MTTWTTIPDASLDPNKPARSVDAKALRDNPIAIAEGAASAPKVRTAALNPPSAGSGNTLAIFSITYGSALTAYPNPWHVPTSGSYVFRVIVGGVIRCEVSHHGQGGATSYLRVLKNGVEVIAWSTASTTEVSRSVDVSVSSGDSIVFQSYTSNASFPSVVTNPKITSATPDFAVA